MVEESSPTGYVQGTLGYGSNCYSNGRNGLRRLPGHPRDSLDVQDILPEFEEDSEVVSIYI